MTIWKCLWFHGLVLEEPSLYLMEVCAKVKKASGTNISEATICKLLHRHGLSIRQVALQRSAQLRGEFIAKVLMYNKELFVWFDESGSDNRNCMRKYGYAL